MKKSEIRIGMVTTLVNFNSRFNDGMIVTVKEFLPDGKYLVKDIYDKVYEVKARNLTDDVI